MDGLRIGTAVSPRRRRDVRDSYAVLERTLSDSSTSSDILVAGPPHTPTQQTPQRGDYHKPQSLRSTPSRPTKAWFEYNRFKIRFGSALAKDKFRAIVRIKPTPSSEAAMTDISSEDEFDDDVSDEDEDPDDGEDDDGDEDDVEETDENQSESSEGPNHRGTYSKKHTLRHPEINWVHRGQGRYLPASDVKADSPASSPRPTRHTNERAATSVAISEQTMEDMTTALARYFEDYRIANGANARSTWSPSFKSQFNEVLHLIKTTPRQQWPKVIDSIGDRGIQEVTREWSRAMDREFPMHGSIEHDENGLTGRARPSRQIRLSAVQSIEQRRSTRLTDAPNSFSYGDDDGDESDDSQDPDATFRKDYVDTHPDERFYHTGNGWYKRGSRPAELEKRRGSTASHAIKSVSSETSRELDANTTIHAEDLHMYVGQTFHHKGNGWYRPGVAPNGRKGTIQIGQDGNTIPFKPGDAGQAREKGEEDEVALLPPGATVDKAFTLRHPSIEWVHRGQGRYKRKSSVFGSMGGTMTPAPSLERRSSKIDNSFNKDYAESHASDDLGLRRTSSRATANKRTSRPFTDLPEPETIELFDKSYVEAHPDEIFHHRGQGRYARGPKPRPIDTEEPAGNQERMYFDSAYVNSHPEETFHHRGQGKWIRGLPLPGASNKTAVKGPGAAIIRGDSARVGEENEDGEKPPPPSTLLRKAEGPDKWPHLHWTYRGGGKWCRQTKEESQRIANAGYRKARTLPGRTRDGPEAQLYREARAAEAYPRRGDGPGRYMRRRRGRGAISKVSSNSDLAPLTPRPPLLAPEEDQLADEDLPSLYKDDWSDEYDEDIDEAGHILRKDYRPIIGADAFVNALTKHDPAVRSLANLKQLAENAQWALRQLQDEYLELDVIVAQNPMHGKKERKPVKGGRQTIDTVTWEDKKEAMLYDYAYDPRRTGYQDPDAQRIMRDADGRELRRRRHRADPHHSAVDYGDGEMTTKRTVKPVSRFDGVVIPPPRKRSRLTGTADDLANEADDQTPTVTPERVITPANSVFDDAILNYRAPTRGRWKDHVPKRILELREESVASTRSGTSTSPKPTPTNPGAHAPTTTATGVRKGRPPGSKNLHKRKDAGIKKGPRKPKLHPPGLRNAAVSPAQSVELDHGYPGDTMDGVERSFGRTSSALVSHPHGNMPAGAAGRGDPMALGRATYAPSFASTRY